MLLTTEYKTSKELMKMTRVTFQSLDKIDLCSKKIEEYFS